MKKLTLFLLLTCFAFSSFAQSTGDLENQFYIRTGFSLPTKSYLFDNSDLNFGSRFGSITEFGSIYMFNFLKLADGLRIGINVDWAEITYHKIEVVAFNSVSRNVLRLSSNVGPSISYSPIPDLVIDAYVKMKDAWGAVILYDGDAAFGLFGFGFDTGINVRYRSMMAGFEFNRDRIRFGDDIDEAFDSTIPTRPLPSINFTFGFSW